jgi:hypothetical protein
MKREDFVLGATAVAMQEGNLSPSESAIGNDEAPAINEAATREMVESLLYEHVSAASRARQAMDRLHWCPEYHAHYRAREIALMAASRNYARLLELGGAISPLLAQMIDAEGGLAP